MIFLGTLFIIAACNRTIKEFHKNGKLKSEIVQMKGNESLLREFNTNGQLVAEYEIENAVKVGTGKHFSNGKIDFKSTWIDGIQSTRIMDFSGYNEIVLEHTLPDTSVTNTRITGKIFSTNAKWKIKEAYFYCPIDSDGIFRERHRFEHECGRFLVEDNAVIIEFTSVGSGDKDFPLTTIIFENDDGLIQGKEFEYKYFLK